MRYVLIASGAIGDVGRPDFVGVFAERYLSFKSTFERALSARAYFGFFKIAAHCPTPCSCTPASNAAFSASVHLRLPCLCAFGLKTTDFANGDNGGVLFNCAVARALLASEDAFPGGVPGLDWSRVPDLADGFDYAGLRQEEIVNLGLRDLVLNAFVDP